MINTKKSKKDSPNILINICFFLYYSSRKIKKLFSKKFGQKNTFLEIFLFLRKSKIEFEKI